MFNLRSLFPTLLLAPIACVWLVPGFAAEPDSAVMSYELPDQIDWVDGAGASQAVLVGDPSKPGLYVVLVKWHPGHMSRPHFHPNDRFITVISGTWWVGWARNRDLRRGALAAAGTPCVVRRGLLARAA